MFHAIKQRVQKRISAPAPPQLMTHSDLIKAAEAQVEDCNQRMVKCDSEIAAWAARHHLHFDGEGAVATWPPERVKEFRQLNFTRNEIWNEFQSALKEHAHLKTSTPSKA